MAEFLIRIDDAGQATLFELPAVGAPIQMATGALGAIDPVIANILQGSVNGLQPAGESLFRALQSALGQPLIDLLNQAAPQTIYLEIADAYAAYPWEILMWRRPIAGGMATAALVTSAHHLIRVYAPDWSAAALPVEGPLRLLIAVGALPDDAAVGGKIEVSKIKASLHAVNGLIDLEVVQGFAALYGRLSQFRPHILHFIGHGSNNPPNLWFAPIPAQGNQAAVAAHPWDSGEVANDIGSYLLGGWRPNLVVLNACRSATGNHAGADTLAPMAGAFLAANVPAVIAMQGDIKGDAAGEFAGDFYAKLAKGERLELALSFARTNLRVRYGLAGIQMACFPSVTLRRRPGAVLPNFRLCIANYAQQAQRCALLRKLRVFLNQVEPRRSIAGGIWPVAPGTPRENFIVLRGGSGVGKTVLSTWLLDVAVNLGCLVRYVDISTSKGADCISIVGLIWGISGPQLASPLRQPLQLQPSDALRERLEAKEPGALYGDFRKALAELAEKTPVVVVLDHLSKSMEPDQFWKLWEYLLLRLQDPEMARVVFILCLEESEYITYKVGTPEPHLVAPLREVPLGTLTRDQFLDLVPDYFYYRDDGLRKKAPKLVPLIPEIFDEQNPAIAQLESTAAHCAEFFHLKLEDL